jgi:hypothetical protein
VCLGQRVGTEGGPVVVDGGAQGTGLGGGGHVAVDVLGGEGARPARLATQGPAQRPEVPGRQEPLGQPRGLEGEDVPAPAQLAGAAQALEEADGVGRVEHHQPLDALGVVHGQQPGQPAAPVVPGDRGRAGAQGPDQVGHLLGQHPGPVVADPGRLVGGVVAGQVGRDHPVAGVGQGLSLPALIRRLHLSEGGANADEELHARLVATKATLAQIDALADEDWTRDETVDRMRAWYEYRKRRLAARAGKIQDDGYEDRSLAYQEMVRLVLAAQREALLGMRRDGQLSNETMNRILRELDLEESRLET